MVELVFGLIWLVDTDRILHVASCFGNASELEGSGEPLVISLALDLFAAQNEEKITLLLDLMCLSSTIP
jgi:hypothetical protein